MGMDRLLDRIRRGSGPPATVNEIVEEAGCSRSFVYKLIEAGTLTAKKLGSDYRIPLREAERILRDIGALE